MIKALLVRKSSSRAFNTGTVASGCCLIFDTYDNYDDLNDKDLVTLDEITMLTTIV